MSGADEQFFATLPEVGRFEQVTDHGHYADVPAGWQVVIADVQGSTRAIEAGRYKDVNAIGVAAIVALQNAAPDLSLPYVFGGDGATVVVPGSRASTFEAALRGLARLARETFELELRVGVVPVADLRAAGHAVRVARLRVSPHVCLAALSGGGFGAAERWVKQGRYLVGPEGESSVSLEGFECRWRPVASRRGHVVSLLVLARAADEAGREATYRRAIDALDGIVGSDGKPVSERAMRMQGLRGDYAVEARLRTGQKEGAAFDAHVKQARKETQIGRVLVGLGLSAGSFDGKRYPAELVENTDYRKFDEMLRMVIDVSAGELASLREYLEAGRQQGEIAYGLHVAGAALMTCFVRSYAGDHVHFVDGSDGGYALAAKQLKEQLRAGSHD